MLNKSILIRFNKIFPFENNIDKLREIEEMFDDVVIANYNTPDEGISTISIIRTIIQLLTGRKIAFYTDDENKQILKGIEILE